MTDLHGFEGELFLEDLESLGTTGFAVCAFLSTGGGYELYARRLAESCRRFGLPFSLWRVPAVHHSISWRGSPDTRFTKASFITHCLDRLAGASVAYLDVDTLVVARPEAWFDARRDRRDFAIYNWMHDPHNEAYLPNNRKLVSPEPQSGFYTFSHRVEWLSDHQLNCSGPSQYYADSAAARCLLDRWQHTVTANPRSADDHCLNFAYNNPAPGAPAPDTLWLDKAYTRYPWWPHVAPVILHPGIPAQSQPFLPVKGSAGEPPIHLDRCAPNETPTLFPRDGGVEVRSATIFRIDQDGHPQPVGRYPGRFWIYSEDGVPVTPA